MALVSFFFGIMVLMYNEVGSKHHVPHVHARYAEYACAMDFEGERARRIPSSEADGGPAGVGARSAS